MAPGNANVAEQFKASQERLARVVAQVSDQNARPSGSARAHGQLPPDAEAGAGALVAAINGPTVGPKAAIVISIAETGARA